MCIACSQPGIYCKLSNLNIGIDKFPLGIPHHNQIHHSLFNLHPAAKVLDGKGGGDAEDEQHHQVEPPHPPHHHPHCCHVTI